MEARSSCERASHRATASTARSSSDATSARIWYSPAVARWEVEKGATPARRRLRAVGAGGREPEWLDRRGALVPRRGRRARAARAACPRGRARARARARPPRSGEHPAPARRGYDRQRQGEGRPRRARRDLERAAVRLGDRPRDEEPEARARLRVRAVHAAELLEDQRPGSRARSRRRDRSPRSRRGLPASATSTSTLAPGGEYLTALSIRFASTCRSLARSPRTSGGLSGDLQRRPRRSSWAPSRCDRARRERVHVDVAERVAEEPGVDARDVDMSLTSAREPVRLVDDQPEEGVALVVRRSGQRSLERPGRADDRPRAGSASRARRARRNPRRARDEPRDPAEDSPQPSRSSSRASAQRRVLGEQLVLARGVAAAAPRASAARPPPRCRPRRARCGGASERRSAARRGGRARRRGRRRSRRATRSDRRAPPASGSSPARRFSTPRFHGQTSWQMSQP